MSIKAARGAGHPIGLAEDMGKATLWLCKNNFDGIGVLITELRTKAGPVQYETTANGIVLNGGSTACLAVCGMDGLAARMSDKAILKSVGNPLMLLGVCAITSIAIKSGVKLGDWARLDQGRVEALGDDPPIGEYVLQLLTSDDSELVEDPVEPIEIEEHRWSVLEAMAARTYVPATAESRIAGAGAGLTDND